jgi:hypothetical protein
MDTLDEKLLLGKFTEPAYLLPGNPSKFTPDSIWGPENSFTPPEWFLKMSSMYTTEAGSQI